MVIMGGGYWDPATYTSTTKAKVAAGTTFSYDRTARSTGALKAHADLAANKRNADNFVLRESRDSVEHPTSVPIVVGFDATGSMGNIPRVAQKNLAKLFQLLLDKKYVDDPQIAITAYGDAYTDRVPLQISQFESDNRIDTNLDNLFLEGGGGGNGGETQTLLWYYLANHTVTDAYEKRGKKGYLFIIADEISLPLEARHVTEALGISRDEVNSKDLTVEGVVAHLKERWDTYIILEDNFSAKRQGSRAFYTRLFGADHIIDAEGYDTIAEVIGGAIGFLEGAADDSKLEEDLLSIGVSAANASRTSQALARINRASTAVNADIELATDGDVLARL
jgi:hypothetical protein